jgi:hypothetical protein
MRAAEYAASARVATIVRGKLECVLRGRVVDAQAEPGVR